MTHREVPGGRLRVRQPVLERCRARETAHGSRRIAAAKRDPLVPDLQTVAESGLPGFEISGWYGIFAPAKTPAEIVAKLAREISSYVATAEGRAQFAKIGVNVLGGTPEEFAAYIRREDAKWTKAIRDSGTKVD